MLEDLKKRFVCALFHAANRSKDRPVDSNKIFSEIHTRAFTDKQGAQDELITLLLQEESPKIQYDESNKTAWLTESGLEWAKPICDTLPYHEYRSYSHNM